MVVRYLFGFLDWLYFDVCRQILILYSCSLGLTAFSLSSLSVVVHTKRESSLIRNMRVTENDAVNKSSVDGNDRQSVNDAHQKVIKEKGTMHHLISQLSCWIEWLLSIALAFVISLPCGLTQTRPLFFISLYEGQDWVPLSGLTQSCTSFCSTSSFVPNKRGAGGVNIHSRIDCNKYMTDRSDHTLHPEGDPFSWFPFLDMFLFFNISDYNK